MTDTVLICLWVETVGVRLHRHCLSTRTAMVSIPKTDDAQYTTKREQEASSYYRDS